MMSRAVALPNLFWELDVHVPKRETWRDAAFDEAYRSLKYYEQIVSREEQTGIVDRTDIINLLLSAWALRGQKGKVQQKDPELGQRLASMREVAKRYGLTRDLGRILLRHDANQSQRTMQRRHARPAGLLLRPMRTSYLEPDQREARRRTSLLPQAIAEGGCVDGRETSATWLHSSGWTCQN